MKQSSVIKFCLIAVPLGITLIGAFSLIYSFNAPASKPREGGRSVLNVNVLSTPEELRSWVKRQTNDIGPRPWNNADQTRVTAKWIESELSEENIGYRPKITFLEDNKSYRMVEAELAGEKTPSEVLLIISSFSSPEVGPGDHSGASQISMMLGLARYFVNTENARTLRFVASPSSYPDVNGRKKLGSSYVAKKSKRPSEKIIGVIEIGTLGFFSQEENSQSSMQEFNINLPNKGDFIALIGDKFSHQSMGSIISGLIKSIDLPVQKVLLDNNQLEAFSGLSLFRNNGYPIIKISDTGSLRYSSADTPKKIDYHKNAQLLKAMSLVISDELNP